MAIGDHPYHLHPAPPVGIFNFQLIKDSSFEKLMRDAVQKIVIAMPDGSQVELVNELQLREQLAREALALLQHSGDDSCTCPKYPDGETVDGHMCFKFQLLDLITKDERVSDRIDKENKNV